jgi:hypothetical protein
VGPVNKVVERRQIRRAAEDALADPLLRLPLEPPNSFDERSDDLPPGFGGVTRSNGFGAPQPFTSLTFRVPPAPWYRTNGAKFALVVLGLGTAVAALVVLLWPSSTPEPQPRDAGSTSVPAPSPSASPTQPAPPSAQPPPVSPPPLPPAPSADQMAPPASPPAYHPPQYDAPTQKKPELDVTRAPMSVAPTIKGPAGPSGSAIPGDGPPKHHGWHF